MADALTAGPSASGTATGGPAPDAGGDGRLDLHLLSAGQLVVLDAAWPLHPGCLRPGAEAAIIEWARQQPAGRALSIVVHLPDGAVTTAEAALLRGGLADHFRRLSEEQGRLAAEQLADAQRSLAVGLAILAACMGLAWVLATVADGRPSAVILRESVGILGWVAMWKPVEMLLHDRRPILRRRRLLRRLCQARIEVVATAGNGTLRAAAGQQANPAPPAGP
jgi:hypothetical protein